MPFVDMNTRKRLSDLIVNEYEPSIGYCRESINVTPPAGGATVKVGQVVFRVKSLDPAAAYAVLSADTQLVATNEFAVVIGDEYSHKEEFVPNAIQAGEFNAVSVKRGPIILKEYYVKQIAQDAGGAALTDAEFVTLKELLKAQGVIAERTL